MQHLSPQCCQLPIGASDTERGELLAAVGSITRAGRPDQEGRGGDLRSMAASEQGLLQPRGHVVKVAAARREAAQRGADEAQQVAQQAAQQQHQAAEDELAAAGLRPLRTRPDGSCGFQAAGVASAHADQAEAEAEAEAEAAEQQGGAAAAGAAGAPPPDALQEDEALALRWEALALGRAILAGWQQRPAAARALAQQLLALIGFIASGRALELALQNGLALRVWDTIYWPDMSRPDAWADTIALQVGSCSAIAALPLWLPQLPCHLRRASWSQGQWGPEWGHAEFASCALRRAAGGDTPGQAPAAVRGQHRRRPRSRPPQQHRLHPAGRAPGRHHRHHRRGCRR
jgi:hypothetical protein